MAADWGDDGVSDGANAEDVSVKHPHQHGADRLPPPHSRPQRVEVITSQRRRSWSKEEKAAITAESFSIGANISEVARRHGVSVGLLHHWRRKARKPVEAEAMRFIPVLPDGQAATSEPAGGGSIQIDYGGARIRTSGAVDPQVMTAVLVALRTLT